MTLEQCQAVADALGAEITFEVARGRVYLSWTTYSSKLRQRRRWDAPEGSHFPTWHRRAPWGGTRSYVFDQLVRRCLGKSVMPLAEWQDLIEGPAKLGGKQGPAVMAAVVATGWPEEVPCFLCGKPIQLVGDWWTTGEKGKRKSGPSCSMRDCRQSKAVPA